MTTLGTVPIKMLMAISCGAVFMGANTYIGNAPNFMVKSIADETCAYAVLLRISALVVRYSGSGLCT